MVGMNPFSGACCRGTSLTLISLSFFLTTEFHAMTCEHPNARFINLTSLSPSSTYYEWKHSLGCFVQVGLRAFLCGNVPHGFRLVLDHRVPSLEELIPCCSPRCLWDLQFGFEICHWHPDMLHWSRARRVKVEVDASIVVESGGWQGESDNRSEVGGG